MLIIGREAGGERGGRGGTLRVCCTTCVLAIGFGDITGRDRVTKRRNFKEILKKKMFPLFFVFPFKHCAKNLLQHLSPPPPLFVFCRQRVERLCLDFYFVLVSRRADGVSRPFLTPLGLQSRFGDNLLGIRHRYHYVPEFIYEDRSY